MKNNVRIAKELVRLARTLLAFSRNELESQLRQMKIPNLNVEENLACLEKMSPKEQKAALFWIRKGSLILPEDEGKFKDAMNLVNKQHLDFQKFERPMDVINRDDKSTTRIKSQDMAFNPDKEPAFKNKKSLKNGVVVYWVDDSREGQMAVRRAIDTSWGYNKNPWCLAARKSGFDPNEIARLTEEQKQQLGLYGKELDTAWGYWNSYNSYPKRIAFQNGELLAFCANNKNEIKWWDKNDKPHGNIPGLRLRDDDVDFLLEYGKMSLARSQNTPVDWLDRLADDEDWSVRDLVSKNPRTSLKTLVKLMDDDDDYVRQNVADNPKTTIGMLFKMMGDESMYVRRSVAHNQNTTSRMLDKLADDNEEYVREYVARNMNTSAEALDKLADDKCKSVKSLALQNSNTSPSTLERFLHDQDNEIRLAVAHNDNATAEILRTLANDSDGIVRSRVAIHDNTPVDALEKLSKDKDSWARRNVARNPNTTVEILKSMLDDESSEVSKMAMESLQRKNK